MAKSYDEIISDIDAHFGFNSSTDYSEYYIGITNDGKRRLGEHNVTTAYIYRTATSDGVARDVEQYYIGQGCKGGGGGGNDDSVVVYCYKITPSTVEDTNEN